MLWGVFFLVYSSSAMKPKQDAHSLTHSRQVSHIHSTKTPNANATYPTSTHQVIQWLFIIRTGCSKQSQYSTTEMAPGDREPYYIDTLGPKHVLLRYMDPYTLNPYRALTVALKGPLKGSLMIRNLIGE